MDDFPVGSCSLVISGERYAGFDCLIGGPSLGSERFGLLTGPVKPMVLAKLQGCPVELECPGENTRTVSISRVSNAGVFVVIELQCNETKEQTQC